MIKPRRLFKIRVENKVNWVLKALVSLERLVDRQNVEYRYTTEDINKVFGALEEALASARKTWEQHQHKEPPFTLED